jgi:OmcA/MtrC family decaheme c-type cytochrome
MRIHSKKALGARVVLVAAVVVGSVALVSAPRPNYSIHDKAFYADENLVSFVRPGLQIKIESAGVTADGTISTTFDVSDPNGLPLDKDGIYTPGTVALRFIAAYIPKGQEQYTDYITRIQTSPITGASAVQANDESNGTFAKLADGRYTYTFGTKAPAGFDNTVTHTIGITAARDLTEFGLGTDLAAATFNFVPNGSPVTVTRDVIRTVSCNKCHVALTAHGETGRTGMPICVLCHQPQTKDPDTGNTVDLKVMAHKIHMGSQLPSVQAGTPYEIIGFGQAVVDFSEVVFPADPRNCTFCHEQTTGAAQATAYLKPAMAPCGACHDNVNFATGQNHADLPQISNDQCAFCHFPQGELPFDTSVVGAHTIPRFAPGVPGVVFTLVKVDNGLAGQKPTVTFTIKDKAGNAIPPSAMGTLNLSVAGPTTDYASVVTENAKSAQASTGGNYSYTFSAAIPAGATGTYAVGIEGRRSVTLLPGTQAAVTVQDAGANQVMYFSVDGSPVTPRRTDVALNIPETSGPVHGCNACHYSLSLHGDLRNQTQYCVFCHNPNGNDSDTRPAAQLPAQSIDLSLMVHKIHTGSNLPRPYVIYNHSGQPLNFQSVLFPGDLQRCDWCHVNNAQQVPSDDALAKLLPVQDPRGLINPVGPVTAACTACHGEVSTASHALSMTTRLGEACGACHSPDDDFAVDKVHADTVVVSQQP